ncbi:tetratricopeptide repeat protein [Alkalinema sp. FACHB-956]|uniref:tetratricopeptide repeat protein n=1 Tax=Alkalinema sp. FACHB-956 TaxID=2692768 RepID=UPI0016873A2B|nr:tetratricopeptide repeat protein [Alkalinema sp. FACHB-956]MBD2327348.1 tetratricopeptide repeat protein [Alkalinema sp. FACHB-956]
MSTNPQILLDQVAQAFEQQDYRAATQILKQLWQAHPENPWVQLYRARLYEVGGNLEAATQVYRQLLQNITIPKLITQARQGLQRVEDLEKAQRQIAIAQVTAAPDQAEPGILVLEAIELEQRQEAAKTLSRIIGIDVYTARVHIPNRGWRIYRMGPIGEMAFYGKQLQENGLPAFWVPVSSLEKLQIFQVTYIQDYEPQAVVICQNSEGQIGNLAFHWSEVSQLVEGHLPIFEQVLETDILRKGSERQRKSETQDFVLVCDLHLPRRNCVLRFCDRTYDFHQGIDFTPNHSDVQTTLRIHWNTLLSFLKQQLSDKPIYHDFSPFAETAIEFPHLLKQLDPKFYLMGQDDSPWNPAFHIYSSLAFFRNRG